MAIKDQIATGIAKRRDLLSQGAPAPKKRGNRDSVGQEKTHALRVRVVFSVDQ